MHRRVILRTSKAEQGINMVDLMMWLVIAALLLAAALQGINHYRQSAYVYQAKTDLVSAHTWAAAKVAETHRVPTVEDLQAAFTKGDLKMSPKNLGIIASSGGAKYCMGVKSPSVNNKATFFSSSDAASEVTRDDAMSSSCGTATSVTASGTIGGGANIMDPSGPMPTVSTARLKFGVSEPQGPLSEQVNVLARQVDEYPGLVATYKDWTQPFSNTEVQAVVSKGAQPMVTWEPFVAGAGVNQPNYQLKDITSGSHDAYIKSWTDSIAATNYDKPILIRFAHEMNGNWYPWAQQVNGNADGDYIAAWKYVHDKFTAAGIQSKVDFVWAPNIPYTGSTDFWKLYPGDTYVDVVGLDGFNFGTTDQYSTWKAPHEVFGSGLWHARDIPNNKPIIITETASVPTEGTHKQEEWVRLMVAYFNESGNSDVIGFVWFDHVKRDELDLGQTKETNWRLDTTQASIDAMKKALADRR